MLGGYEDSVSFGFFTLQALPKILSSVGTWSLNSSRESAAALCMSGFQFAGSAPLTQQGLPSGR